MSKARHPSKALDKHKARALRLAERTERQRLEEAARAAHNAVAKKASPKEVKQVLLAMAALGVRGG